jgi:hypothetical protein
MPQKGQITAVEQCIAYLTSKWDSLDVYPVRHSVDRWYIRSNEPIRNFSSKTIQKAVHSLAWVQLPGYKAAHNSPVGSAIYVHKDNLIKYGERTDSTP